MRVLNLIIKQKYFDAIMQGRKVQEFREIRPTTAKKLVEVDEDGYPLFDDNKNSIPIKYDAIRFFVGYNKDRDSALVEVESAYTELFVQTLTTPDGEPIQFETDENGVVQYFAVDEKKNFLKDENGNFIPTDDFEAGMPMRTTDGRKGSTLEIPIEYTYKGDTWYAEQVVYNLGKIIEKDIKPKAHI